MDNQEHAARALAAYRAWMTDGTRRNTGKHEDSPWYWLGYLESALRHYAGLDDDDAKDAK